MEDELKKFAVALPADVHDCLRWLCPQCGLDFKVDVSEELINDTLSQGFERILIESGIRKLEAEDKVDQAAFQMGCPYCKGLNPRHEFLHPEFVAGMLAHAQRELLEPMLFSMMESAFGGMRKNKYVSVEVPEMSRSTRPVIGPECGDMVRVRCGGCDCLFKVIESWRGGVCCPQCSADLLAV